MESAMAAHHFFDCLGQRHGLPKRSGLPRFDNQTGDASRRWLLSQLAEQMSQFFLTIVVDDFPGGTGRGGIHAHVERSIPHDAESPIGVLELTRRTAEVQ